MDRSKIDSGRLSVPFWSEKADDANDGKVRCRTFCFGLDNAAEQSGARDFELCGAKIEGALGLRTVQPLKNSRKHFNFERFLQIS
jgi:glycine/D-amino acid oxidase-like deaminating enzyme